MYMVAFSLPAIIIMDYESDQCYGTATETRKQ